MEIKKTPEADLEKGRTIFFLMGFAVALSGFFVLLEWKSPRTDPADWTSFGPVFIENEFDGINRQEISVPTGLPVNSDIEIVYEDYVITEEIPVIEQPENTAITHSITELEEIPLVRINNALIAPVENETVSDPVTSAEEMPQFPGGQAGLIRFIYEHIQYPSVALKQRIEGRVWCSFIVETDGSTSNVQLENGVYVFLDEEALRVLKMMPAWIPGRTNGENVRVKVYIPIVFKR
jgi:protein TonB